MEITGWLLFWILLTSLVAFVGGVYLGVGIGYTGAENKTNRAMVFMLDRLCAACESEEEKAQFIGLVDRAKGSLIRGMKGDVSSP